MSQQCPYYPLENLIHVDGNPYGTDSGYVNTISIDGVTYVVLVDIQRLYGEEEEIMKITRGVRHHGSRTVLVDIHRVPHPRLVVPLDRLHQVMTAIRARLDALDEDDSEESEEETPNSEDEEYIVDDDASIEVESEPGEKEEDEEEEEETESDQEDEETDQEEEEEVHPGTKRSAGSVSSRPRKYSKH